MDFRLSARGSGAGRCRVWMVSAVAGTSSPTVGAIGPPDVLEGPSRASVEQPQPRDSTTSSVPRRAELP
jgi:hypothetical protein